MNDSKGVVAGLFYREEAILEQKRIIFWESGMRINKDLEILRRSVILHYSFYIKMYLIRIIGLVSNSGTTSPSAR